MLTKQQVLDIVGELQAMSDNVLESLERNGRSVDWFTGYAQGEVSGIGSALKLIHKAIAEAGKV